VSRWLHLNKLYKSEIVQQEKYLIADEYVVGQWKISDILYKTDYDPEPLIFIKLLECKKLT
jgi:hypothetical protein